ncbi:MAG: sugar ABC transporter permease [Clostridia bacterium]|nr:sugar ABC transporter permease [Clostridia bacterium]
MKSNEATVTEVAGKHKKKKYGSTHWLLTLMALPGILIIFIFKYLPMGGLILAFKNYKYSLGILGSEWVGMKNFMFLFNSSTFSILVRNTVLYNLAFIVLNIVAGIMAALFLDNVMSKRGIKLFQTSMFLPYFLSWIVVSYISLSLLDYDKGIINQILGVFGQNSISFYSETKWWPAILIFFNTWKNLGFNALIYYGTIISIDSELYEAATIDGCGYFRRVKYITIPHLKPTVIILGLLALSGIFRSDFGLFYYLPADSGALYDVTDVLDTYITRSILNTSSLGQSTATGLVQSIVGLLLILTVNSVVRKYESESALF